MRRSMNSFAMLKSSANSNQMKDLTTQRLLKKFDDAMLAVSNLAAGTTNYINFGVVPDGNRSHSRRGECVKKHRPHVTLSCKHSKMQKLT